jgi:hypothetical protein
MCRSIKRLRDGTVPAGGDAVHEAARQYVRKVSGFGKPTERHRAAFDRAVEEIAASTQRLLEQVAEVMSGQGEIGPQPDGVRA